MRRTSRHASLAIALCLLSTRAIAQDLVLPDAKPVPAVQVLPLPYQQASFEYQGRELTRYHFGPGLERPFRVPGYPFVPVIFALVNAVIFVLSAVSRPFLAATAAGVLLLGLPAYLFWRRRLPGSPASLPPAAEGDAP